MDLNSVCRLLTSIAVNYPKFKQQISTDDGKINRAVADEWMKRIGFLDYEEADKRFEKYIMGPDAKYPPTISYFLTFKPEKARPVFRISDKVRYYVGPRGELLDEEGREYGNPHDYETPYRMNESGHIVQGNRLVQ